MSNLQTARPLPNEESYLKEKELSELLKSISKIQMNLQGIQTEQRVSNTRQDEHNQSNLFYQVILYVDVDDNYKYSWWITAGESLFFIGLAGF